MSLSQMIVIGIIILIVIPPEKLPGVMREIGRFMNDVRRQTSGIWDDIKKDAAFNPEEFTAKKLLEPDKVAPQGSLKPETGNVSEAKPQEDKKDDGSKPS